MTYCVSAAFDYSSAVCLESKPLGSWLDIETNKTYSSKMENTVEYHCINQDDFKEDPSFARFMCPNHPACFSEKVHHPAYGGYVQYLDKLGFVDGLHRPYKEIEETTIPHECSFIVNPNSKMKAEDLFWVEYAENSPFS